MSWILIPFLVCCVLSGIHAYLGFRVIARNIIFLDLALAQLAALGTTVAVILGWEGYAVSAFAMITTGIGALFFSCIPEKDRGVSQEVVIGLVYVMSVAAIMITLHSAPAEAHRLTDMLVGNILFVSSEEWLGLVAYYLLLFCGYWLLSRQLAKRLPTHSRWHDFFFYLFFGWVVTSSVKVAGVLLVFVFLIVPAVAALWSPATRSIARWLFALGFGVLFSGIGIGISLFWDWPTGAAIVLAGGGLLLLWRGIGSSLQKRLS